MPASDVRFRRPTVITRNGLYVFVYLEYYANYTTSLTECRAYDAAGNNMGYPFTDADNFLSSTGSGVWHGTYWSVTPVTQVWIFKNATLAAQAATIHVWLYNYQGTVIDYA